MTFGKPRPPAQCNRCRLPIVWWHNASREDRMVAVDPSPDPEKGTVSKMVVGEPPNHRMFANILAGPELAEATSRGEQLFMLHATTCPDRRPVNPRPSHVHLDLPNRRIRSRSRR